MTLGDSVSGRVLPGSSSGPLKYLKTVEENELAMFLCCCASVGYSNSRKEVLALVQRVLDSKGGSKSVSNGWWKVFLPSTH